MTTFVSKEIRDGMEAARLAQLRKKSRLRVETGGTSHRLLRLWSTGFSVEKEKVPALRGLVDIYDGGRHLYQCLIVASEEDGGEMRYEFKRNTAASDKAPLDFIRDPNAPIALLPR